MTFVIQVVRINLTACFLIDKYFFISLYHRYIHIIVCCYLCYSYWEWII